MTTDKPKFTYVNKLSCEKVAEQGKRHNITMKPTLMRGWVVIKETKRSLVVRKTFKKRYNKSNYIGDCYYLPKKNILKIEVSK